MTKEAKQRAIDDFQYSNTINGITVHLAKTSREYHGLQLVPDMLYGHDAYTYYATYGDMRDGRMIVWRSEAGTGTGHPWEATDGGKLAAVVRQARRELRNSLAYLWFHEAAEGARYADAFAVACAACRAYGFI